MKLKTDPRPLVQHATTCFYNAAEDTLIDAANTAPWLTGEYSKSLKLSRRSRPSGPTARIGSKLPQAGAIERGAWVREGRGPHISRTTAPGTLREAGDGFIAHYTRRLGSTPIHAATFLSHDLGGELGLPGLELVGR